MFDETDVPNYNNLPFNNEKLFLPFIKASFGIIKAVPSIRWRKFVFELFLAKTVNKLQNLSKHSISRCAITPRTEEISICTYITAKNRLINCKYFSISFDESTDINNICQLLICIKTVNANLNCFEEMLEVFSLHGLVTRQVPFDAIDSKVFSIVNKN